MKKIEIVQKITKKLKVDSDLVMSLISGVPIDIADVNQLKIAMELQKYDIVCNTGSKKKKSSKGSVTKEEYIDNLDVDNKMFAYRIKSRMKKPESIDGFIVGKKSTDGNGNSITKFYLITESEL